MKPATAPWRLLLCVLLLSQTGCAWWRHRHAPAADVAQPAAAAPGPVASAAPVEATAPEPGPLTPTQIKSAAALATDFYEMHMRMAARGLPAAGTANAYGAFLCPGLVTTLETARARQQQFIRTHPQQKPPLADGDLFSSLFEGADGASALETSATATGARVVVALSRGTGSDALRWKDELLLERDDQVWCVADVEYRGTWQSANRGRLSERLKAE